MLPIIRKPENSARAILFCLCVELAGALIPLQARANAALSGAIGSLHYGILISLVVSAILVLCIPRYRRASFELLGGRMRWWEYGAGSPGAIYITVVTLSMAQIGVFVVAVCAIGGQLLGGLLLGWRELKERWFLAIATVLLAIGAVVMTRSGHPIGDSLPLWLLCLITVSGAGITWQFRTVGGLGRRELTSGTSAGGAVAVSSLTGAAMAAVLLIVLVVAGQASPVPSLETPLTPWHFMGGVFGVGIIACSAIFAPLLNPLVYMLHVTFGYLVCGIVLDAVDGKPGNLWVQLGAVGLLGLAVYTSKVSRTPRRVLPVT